MRVYRHDDPRMARVPVIRARGFHVVTIGPWRVIWGAGRDRWTKHL